MDLRCCHWNVENLFLFMDLYTGDDLKLMSEKTWQELSTSSSTPNKELKKVFDLRDTIIDIDADIYFLNEVGGLDSLRNFNHYFLDNAYDVYLIEGNSDRGIDVGYLVKKTIPNKFLHITHKNRAIDLIYPNEPLDQKHFFSRDISELRMLSQDNSKVEMIFLITHLKSKLDPESKDFEGIKRRTAELTSLVKLYNEIQSEFDGHMPVCVAGDFNGIAQNPGYAVEFEYLYKNSDLKAVMDLKQASDEQRTTKVQFSRGASPKYIQIDFIFLSPHLVAKADLKQSYVYRFKNKKGEALPLPEQREERYALPSDHYPIVLELKSI